MYIVYVSTYMGSSITNHAAIASLTIIIRARHKIKHFIPTTGKTFEQRTRVTMHRLVYNYILCILQLYNILRVRNDKFIGVTLRRVKVFFFFFFFLTKRIDKFIVTNTNHFQNAFSPANDVAERKINKHLLVARLYIGYAQSTSFGEHHCIHNTPNVYCSFVT